MPPVRTESQNLMTMKQHVQRQLAAVIQLSRHKAGYLEFYERSWVEDVINEATPLAGDGQVSSWLNLPREDKSSSPATEQDSKGSSVAVVDIDKTSLLSASRKLNSANSLLSCCYERWLWLQSAQSQLLSSSPDTDDLQELLGRRRRRRKQSGNVSLPTSGPVESPQCEETVGSASSMVGTSYEDGSEHSLSLALDSTIEKWRQNAEDALNEATTRLDTGSNGDPHSPTRQIRQGAHGNSLRFTKDDHPSLKVARALTASHTVPPPASALTPSSKMSSTRHPLQFTGAFHLGVVGAICEHCSQEQTSTSQDSGDSTKLRSAFRSTLHDDFDKEVVDCLTLQTTSGPPQHSAQLSSMHSRDSSEPTLSLPNSKQPMTDLRSRSAPTDTDDTSGKKRDDLQTNMSVPSLQSTTSSNTYVARSRGRRRLEQQAERAGANC